MPLQFDTLRFWILEKDNKFTDFIKIIKTLSTKDEDPSLEQYT